MQYQDQIHKHTPGMKSDVFDGSNYCSLCKQQVKFQGKYLNHRYFADRCDVALGLSTDGFAPFK
jgi:hypothetical protein